MIERANNGSNNRLPRQGALILLVEDNEINQEVAKALLEDARLKVHIANHGAEALQMVQKQNYDLILMDMQMPVMDGLEATEKIRQLDIAKTIPIVAMTANAFIEDRQRCLEAGMNDFVAKPVDPKLLYSKLAEWIPETSNDESRPHSHTATSVDTQNDEQQTDVSSKSAHINLNIGLKFFNGNQLNYQRMLSKFGDTYGADAEKIQSCLLNADYATAERIAHTLKGIAATLGMEALRSAAFDLEHLIHSEQANANYSEQISQLKFELECVIHEIELLIQKPESDENSDIENQQLKSLLAELETQLIDDSPTAADIWQALKPALALQVNQQILVKLDQQITNFDLDDALKTLHVMVADLNLK